MEKENDYKRKKKRKEIETKNNHKQTIKKVKANKKNA